MASTTCSVIAVVHHHLDLHLRQEIDHIFGAAIQLGMALLAAEALHFGDGQAGDVHLGQRLAHFVELERFDHAGNLFHDGFSFEVL
jgi:hypothetical protein